MGCERRGQVVIRNIQGEMKRTSEGQTQRDQMRGKRRVRLVDGEKETRKLQTKKEMISEQMTHYQERA